MILSSSSIEDALTHGDEADETTWRFCGTPLSTTLKLRYVSPGGLETEGFVDVRYFNQSGLFGRCRVTGSDREFSYLRIRSCHGADGTVAIHKTYEHLSSLYVSTPDHTFDEVTSRYSDALRTLLYVMEHSGYQQHQIVESITSICKQWSKDSRINTLHGARFYLRHKGASFHDFRRTAGKVNYNLVGAQKMDFLKVATQAATQFGPTNLHNREALKHMAKLFART